MGGSHRVERQHSNSPPVQAQQPSKRDKKRTLLADRLADITMSFSINRDSHYRTQLQAIQIDSNLIAEADCSRTLLDDANEIDELVKENVVKTNMKSAGNEVPLRAGRIYADFAKEVNDAQEERDAALTTLKVSAPRRRLFFDTDWYVERLRRQTQ